MAQFSGLVAIVQTVIISVTFPAVLNTTVILTGELSRLTLRRGDVRRVCFTADVVCGVQ